MDGVNREEVRAIIEHFKGTPLTNEIIAAFCKRKEFTPISADQYEDFLFQYNHDQRIDKLLPDLLAVITKIRNVPEFASHNERDTIKQANEGLEIEVCELFEKHNILYQEIELICGGLGDTFNNLMRSAARRVNNMAAKELLDVAEAQFGKPLTIKALGEHNRKK